MLMALTAVHSGIPAVEWHFYAISIAIYATISLGSQTCYIWIDKRDGYPHLMPKLKLLYWTHPLHYKDPCSSLFIGPHLRCVIFLKKKSVFWHLLSSLETLFQCDKKVQVTAAGQTYCLLGSAEDPRSAWLLSLAGQYLQPPPGSLAGDLCRIRSQHPSSWITGRQKNMRDGVRIIASAVTDQWWHF